MKSRDFDRTTSNISWLMRFATPWRAYNRTTHLAERKKMMQAWADYPDALRVSADNLPIPEVWLEA